MVDEERRCVCCRDSHQAAAWYERRVDNRHEYLCGVEYFKLADKTGWAQVYPGDD